MVTQTRAIVITALAAASFMTLPARAAEEKPSADGMASVAATLPSTASDLVFRWDDASSPGARRVAGYETPHLKAARESSVGWVKEVLSSDWLPDDNVINGNMTMIENQFGAVDATHVAWRTLGFTVRVSQTATVVAVTVAPPSPLAEGASADGKKEAVRKLCSNLLRNLPAPRGVNPGGARLKGLAPRGTLAALLDASFTRGAVKECSDGIVGLAAAPADESPDKVTASSFWWGTLDWWTDGKVVGFVALKLKGSRWIADHAAEADANWFESSRAGTEDDLREAIFRVLFAEADTRTNWKGACFVSLEGGADPSPEFLKRFSDYSRPMKPASEAVAPFQPRRGPRGRTVSEDNLIFRINSIVWLNDYEADARADYNAGNSRLNFRLKCDRIEGKWKVTVTEATETKDTQRGDRLIL